MMITEQTIPGGIRFKINGPLDHATGQPLRDRLISPANGNVEMDLMDCPFISSAGLRLILEGHKSAKAAGKRFQLINVSTAIEKILETTGLSRLVNFSGVRREISVEGTKLLSAGACGECYRLNEDTVVKLYFPRIAEEVVEREKRFAREAFILGVPTAISYEIVRSGDRLGVIYEMLDAKLFSQVIREDLEHLDKYARMLASVAQSIHAIKGNPAIFPKAKDMIRNNIRELSTDLPAEDIEMLLQRLDRIPDTDECVHLDLHTSNIMVRDDAPIIIDMGEFSIGNYLFDLGQWCTIYGYPELNTCEIVTKIPSDKGKVFLDKLLDAYFAERTQEERAEFERNRYFLASLRTIGAAAIVPDLRELLVKMIREFYIPRIRAEGAAG